jgi:hypothetical protein
MADPVWPVQSDEWPEWWSKGGVGVMLMRNTRPDAEGRFFATSWLVLLLPIAPLARYWLREGETTSKWGRTTTRYQVFGESRIRPIETVRTYLCCWGLVPVVLVPLNSHDRLPWGLADAPYELGAVLPAFCLATLYAVGWTLFGLFLRPVREGRKVAAPPPPRRPRWPDSEDDMWR